MDFSRLTRLQRHAALQPFTNNRGRVPVFEHFPGGYTVGLSLNR